MIRVAGESSVLVARHLKRLRRVPLVLFLSMFQSMLWLVLFPLSFERLDGMPDFRSQGYSSYLAFFVPSALTMSMLSAAFQSGMGTVEDIEHGLLDKLLISPVLRSSILVGKIAADAIRMFFQGLIVVLVALALGASFETGIGGVALMLAVSVPFGVAWAGLSNTVALRTRSSEATMVIGVILTFPMLFLSTAIMPAHLLPAWLRTASRLNPVTYLIDFVRDLVNFGYDWTDLAKVLAVIAAVGTVTLTTATRSFRRAVG